MAVLGPHYSDFEVAVTDFRLAEEFPLVTSPCHQPFVSHVIEGARVLHLSLGL